MTLPLVIGIGVTNGIHILNRFAEEQTPSILARSTGKAVLVSGLTTIAGFGSLMLAQHQGIHSLGCVMTDGSGDLHDCGVDVLAGAVEPADAPAAADKNNPVPTMHDRHWVGRNRGKNLKYVRILHECHLMSISKFCQHVNVFRQYGHSDNVTARGPTPLKATPGSSALRSFDHEMFSEIDSRPAELRSGRRRHVQSQPAFAFCSWP